MGLETEYVEYGVELSLAMLGISAAYFIDINYPITLAGLILLPVLYGYTAYISREGFNKASLVTSISLIFGIVGGVTALAAIAFSFGNILVSALAGGKRFRDFYSSTSIPLLLTGLMVGASIYGYGAVNPDFRSQSIDRAGEEVGKIAEKSFADSGMIENQRESQIRVINSTSRATAALMVQSVLNQSNPSPEVRNTLVNSQTTVPNLVYERTVQNTDKNQPDISGRVQDSFTTTFNDSKFFLVIPLTTGLLYSLQPLLGLLTALFGKLFARLDG